MGKSILLSKLDGQLVNMSLSLKKAGSSLSGTRNYVMVCLYEPNIKKMLVEEYCNQRQVHGSSHAVQSHLI